MNNLAIRKSEFSHMNCISDAPVQRREEGRIEQRLRLPGVLEKSADATRIWRTHEKEAFDHNCKLFIIILK